MRSLFITFLIMLSTAHAATMEVEVIQSEIGLNDYLQQPTLCLTAVRDIKSGKLFGIVEDIGDCYWTRRARRSPEKNLKLSMHQLSPVMSEKMRTHLQGFDSQLEFLWSQAD